MRKTLRALCEKVKCESRFGAAPYNPEFRDANGYKVTLHYKGRSLTVPFYQGIGITDDPKAERVLECLLSDASGAENAGGFVDWCDEYGFEMKDLRRAERIYKACEATVPRLKRFLGDDYQTFMEAEQG